jgi:hypothetical protein
MADAREKLTTPLELVMIPEAMALLLDEGLDTDEARLLLTGALLSGNLRGGDQKGPGHFRELAANLQHGVAEVDLKAIRRLSRGLAIPWESWTKWIGDGSVDWKNSEIARDLRGHVAIFTPVFRREDLLSLVPRFDPTSKYASEQIASAPMTGSHASADKIRHALRTVYSSYAKGEGPNLNQIVPLVQELLKKEDYRASKQRIQEIAAEPEFADTRGEVGKHRKRTPRW